MDFFFSILFVLSSLLTVALKNIRLKIVFLFASIFLVATSVIYYGREYFAFMHLFLGAGVCLILLFFAGFLKGAEKGRSKGKIFIAITLAIAMVIIIIGEMKKINFLIIHTSENVFLSQYIEFIVSKYAFVFYVFPVIFLYFLVATGFYVVRGKDKDIV